MRRITHRPSTSHQISWALWEGDPWVGGLSVSGPGRNVSVGQYRPVPIEQRVDRRTYQLFIVLEHLELYPRRRRTRFLQTSCETPAPKVLDHSGILGEYPTRSSRTPSTPSRVSASSEHSRPALCAGDGGEINCGNRSSPYTGRVTFILVLFPRSIDRSIVEFLWVPDNPLASTWVAGHLLPQLIHRMFGSFSTNPRRSLGGARSGRMVTTSAG
ncbi:hypothetical protein FB45DRAFT_450712 [Roridomyces roridus]|uniref:Uncharacterized protein n=1 Tax=Roridomyces roridus TaxID=1738132 RepID=A0AAD7C2F4_9AGAR|nr:hypothetical protein FB45DRAFT_450712 [Roridomyces roridus]